MFLNDGGIAWADAESAIFGRFRLWPSAFGISRDEATTGIGNVLAIQQIRSRTGPRTGRVQNTKPGGARKGTARDTGDFIKPLI